MNVWDLWYRLDEDHNPVKCESEVDMMWHRHNKRVRQTTLSDGRWVSTVFLGLDHGWGGGRPILFETMVFGAKDGEERKDGEWEDEICERYASWEAAIHGHAQIVERLSGHSEPRKGERNWIQWKINQKL